MYSYRGENEEKEARSTRRHMHIGYLKRWNIVHTTSASNSNF